ncbi:cadherin-5-like [Anableps anableps]
MESRHQTSFNTSMKGHSRRSTLSPNRRNILQNNSTFSPGLSTWSDHRFISQLDRRLSMTCEDPRNSPVNHPKIYQYEGEGSICQSLDILSPNNQDGDLSFLNDLGPQFKTLERVIMADKSGVPAIKKS